MLQAVLYPPDTLDYRNNFEEFLINRWISQICCAWWSLLLYICNGRGLHIVRTEWDSTCVQYIFGLDIGCYILSQHWPRIYELHLFIRCICISDISWFQTSEVCNVPHLRINMNPPAPGRRELIGRNIEPTLTCTNGCQPNLWQWKDLKRRKHRWSLLSIFLRLLFFWTADQQAGSNVWF